MSGSQKRYHLMDPNNGTNKSSQESRIRLKEFDRKVIVYALMKSLEELDFEWRYSDFFKEYSLTGRHRRIFKHIATLINRLAAPCSGRQSEWYDLSRNRILKWIDEVEKWLGIWTGLKMKIDPRIIEAKALKRVNEIWRKEAKISKIK